MPAWLALKALPWRLIGLSALALVFLGLVAALKIERAQNGKLKAQMSALVERSKQKQVEVREVIKEGRTRIVTVEKQARAIEQAPLEGECRTPKAVLEADV